MKIKQLSPGVSSLVLIGTALVWGIAFVVQSIGGQMLGAYSFNGLRMLLGAAVLLICIHAFTDRMGLSKKPETKSNAKKHWVVGLFCGVFLCIASNLQQVALNAGTSSGKAGFITAFYIILVPIIGLVFKHKTRWNIWFAAFIALVGLFLLCMNESLTLSTADLLLLGCALGFACQILCIDMFAKDLDGLRLAAVEFLVCGVLSMVMAAFFEISTLDGGFFEWITTLKNAGLWINLLYMGIFSCGFGYTGQIIAQQNLNSSTASILMSLESVFAVLSGWVFLAQTLSWKELLGCAIMFAAVILAQINIPLPVAGEDLKKQM